MSWLGGLKDSFRTTWVVCKREFKKIVTDSRLRTVVLVAPFLYATFFCFVYIGQTVDELPVAVFRQNDSQAARTYVRMLNASPKVYVESVVYSVEELRHQMASGAVQAGVVIPSDFDLQLKRGRDTRVTVYVDASSMVAANTLANAFLKVTQTFSAGVELTTRMRKGESLDAAIKTFMPVKLDLRTLNNPTFSYSSFMVPGILMAILQQVILLGLALSWTGEKEFGTLSELLSHTRSPLLLMIGKSLPYILINFVVAEFYLRVLFPMNDIPMEGSWVMMMSFTFLFVAVVVSWGLWVSALCKTRLFATQILMFVAMPSFIMSGFTWPTHAMPAPIQALSQMLPLTHFLAFFRPIYLANLSYEYAHVGFARLSVFLVVNLVLAYFAIRRLTKVSAGRLLHP